MFPPISSPPLSSLPLPSVSNPLSNLLSSTVGSDLVLYIASTIVFFSIFFLISRRVDSLGTRAPPRRRIQARHRRESDLLPLRIPSNTPQRPHRSTNVNPEAGREAGGSRSQRSNVPGRIVDILENNMQRAPTAKYKEDLSSGCSICLEEFGDSKPILVLPRCKHVFHEACIKQWLDCKGISSWHTCPICRKVYPPREIKL